MKYDVECRLFHTSRHTQVRTSTIERHTISNERHTQSAEIQGVYIALEPDVPGGIGGRSLCDPTDHQRSAWAQSNAWVQSYRARGPTSLHGYPTLFQLGRNGTRCKIVEVKIRKNNERYHNNRMCMWCVHCFWWIWYWRVGWNFGLRFGLINERWWIWKWQPFRSLTETLDGFWVVTGTESASANSTLF